MKKIITVLTSVAMLLMGTTANLVAKAEEEYYRLGDVNMDGEVDAVDASAILAYQSVRTTQTSMKLLQTLIGTVELIQLMRQWFCRCTQNLLQCRA